MSRSGGKQNTPIVVDAGINIYHSPRCASLFSWIIRFTLGFRRKRRPFCRPSPLHYPPSSIVQASHASHHPVEKCLLAITAIKCAALTVYGTCDDERALLPARLALEDHVFSALPEPPPQLISVTYTRDRRESSKK